MLLPLKNHTNDNYHEIGFFFSLANGMVCVHVCDNTNNIYDHRRLHPNRKLQHGKREIFYYLE